jgi:hypothetical protein
MSRHWSDRFSFLCGAVRYNDLGYLVLQDDTIDPVLIPHAHFVEWDRDEWGDGGQVGWTAIAVSVCKFPTEQMIGIGPLGQARLIGGGDSHDEQMGVGDETPSSRGPLRAVRSIAGRAFAVGMQRQVYRRDGIDLWTCIDRDMRPAPGQIVGFESTDGFEEDDIYAVGWEGEIWHFDGRRWHQSSSPTNFVLTDVCCAGDGNVYACGRVGMLLSGRNDLWRIIEHESMTEDIWSLAWFNQSLYAATYRGLFRLDGDRLIPVDMGKDTPATYFKLSTIQDVMWSIGAKDVMAFDGQSWTRIE